MPRPALLATLLLLVAMSPAAPVEAQLGLPPPEQPYDPLDHRYDLHPHPDGALDERPREGNRPFPPRGPQDPAPTLTWDWRSRWNFTAPIPLELRLHLRAIRPTAFEPGPRSLVAEILHEEAPVPGSRREIETRDTLLAPGETLEISAHLPAAELQALRGDRLTLRVTAHVTPGSELAVAGYHEGAPTRLRIPHLTLESLDELDHDHAGHPHHPLGGVRFRPEEGTRHIEVTLTDKDLRAPRITAAHLGERVIVELKGEHGPADARRHHTLNKTRRDDAAQTLRLTPGNHSINVHPGEAVYVTLAPERLQDYRFECAKNCPPGASPFEIRFDPPPAPPEPPPKEDPQPVRLENASAERPKPTPAPATWTAAAALAAAAAWRRSRRTGK